MVERDAYGKVLSRPEPTVQPRCFRCNRLLAEFVSRPWRIKCGRCKAVNGDDRE